MKPLSDIEIAQKTELQPIVEIAEKILQDSAPHTWILVKGSRGMSMEKVIKALQRLIVDHKKEG